MTLQRDLIKRNRKTEKRIRKLVAQEKETY